MTEITEEILSLRWWISVVLAGLIINLFSAYLKPLVDRRVQALGAFARRHSERLSTHWKERVSRARASDRELIFECARETRQRQEAQFDLLLSVVGMGVLLIATHGAFKLTSTIVFWLYVFIGVFFFSSIAELFRAGITREVIFAARDGDSANNDALDE